MIGKIVALTGGTSGIGLATVKQLLSDGVWVIAIGRDPGRCAQTESELRLLHPNARIDFVVADLSTTAEVRRAAREIAGIVSIERRGLDALINNMAAVSTWRMVTAEGYEQQFAVNHLAGFLLTRELLPLLERGRPGRVVSVGSGSHRHVRMNWDDPMYQRGYSSLRAYSQSKLANVLFSAEFNRRHEGRSMVRAYVFDPGLVRTDIGLKNSSGIERLVWRLRSRGWSAAPAEVPARYLAALALREDFAGRLELYWRRDTPFAADPAGLDPQAGARLWALSERLCREKEQLSS